MTPFSNFVKCLKIVHVPVTPTRSHCFTKFRVDEVTDSPGQPAYFLIHLQCFDSMVIRTL